MVMKLINITNRYSLIALIIFVNLSCSYLASVMESPTNLKMYRDTGLIGEKKTTQGKKAYYNRSTGMTNYVYEMGNLVTPEVIGDVAYFNLNYDYSFNFKCLNWKYNLKAYWFSGDVGEERIGFLASLVSPDKKTFIDVKEIDVPVKLSLATVLTQEQLNMLQSQSYVEDSFVGDDRILAAQQAIQWVLDKNLDGYEIASDGPIKFTSEQINNKVFVRTEIDVFSKKENITKKCVIWALNLRGYRLKRNENVRRMETWICQVISDSSVYPDIVFKARMIPETLDLNPARNVFPNMKE